MTSNYGVISSLNSSFCSLIRSGELYKLRRQHNVVEHWIYFSSHLIEWEAFDPSRGRWMHLPSTNIPNQSFLFSYKECLAVGTELLVFGQEFLSHVIYRYSILTNSWSSVMQMNAPRCLFCSATSGEIAIIAGGCDSHGDIISSVELYNSETGMWKTLPSMNKQRKMCFAVFMDKNFYVIGGIREKESLLTSGEECDFKTGKWTEISSVFPIRARDRSDKPPFVEVISNDLYAVGYADMEVWKYNKQNKVWSTIGIFPGRVGLMINRSLTLRTCGDRLIIIEACGDRHIKVYSWVPSEGPPQ